MGDRHCSTCCCGPPDAHYHVALDFDGVIHAYSRGLHDGSIYDGMMDGFVDALHWMAGRYWRIIVYTARPAHEVSEWLKGRDVTLPVTNVKPIANVYVDDRALHFPGRGSWDDGAFREEVRRRADGGEPHFIANKP